MTSSLATKPFDKPKFVIRLTKFVMILTIRDHPNLSRGFYRIEYRYYDGNRFGLEELYGYLQKCMTQGWWD